MAWGSRTEVVLVIAAREREAREWISKRQDRVRLYVWAPRFASVVGRNPATTLFVGVGDFDLCEDANVAYWWCKERYRRAP